MDPSGVRGRQVGGIHLASPPYLGTGSPLFSSRFRCRLGVLVYIPGWLEMRSRGWAWCSGVGAPEWSWVRSWSWVRPDLPRVVLEPWSGCSRVVLGVSGCSRPPLKQMYLCFVVFNLCLANLPMCISSQILLCAN